MATSSIIDFDQQAEVLQSRAHGSIETADERLVRVSLRRLPKLISLPEALWLGRLSHANRGGNRCVLYYNQPRACPNYLALKYVVSRRETTLATFRLALRVLDQIAAIKRSDAIVTEVTNWRISDRLLRRWGWEPHLAGGWRRHWIKRFYGDYSRVERICHADKTKHAAVPAS